MEMKVDRRAAEVKAGRQKLGQRIASLIAMYQGKSDAARAAGVTTEQLRKYEIGTAKISLEVAANLAMPKNVSLDWLMTGEGQMLADPRGDRPVGTPLPPFLEDSKATLERIVADHKIQALPVDLAERPDLLPLRQELQRLAQSSALPQTQRVTADMLLMLAFDDPDASRRGDERLRQATALLSAGVSTYDEAVAELGWRPHPTVREAIMALAFGSALSGQIKAENIAELLRAIKATTETKF